MAMKRWATYSVMDHHNLAKLVPDILLFDGLVFPYPDNDIEEQIWKDRGWDLHLLHKHLAPLEELVHLFRWGEKQRDLLPDRWETAAIQQDPKQHIEVMKTGTRYAIRQWMDEKGWKVRFMPCFQSLETFSAEARAPSRDKQMREKALAFLVGQKMALPRQNDSEKAFEFAVTLAKKPEYLAAREDLNDFQESLLQKDQWIDDDAREFAKKVSNFNAMITDGKKADRMEWMFFAAKRALDATLVGLPILSLAELLPDKFLPALTLSTVVAVPKLGIEFWEYAKKPKKPLAAGPMAAFHAVDQQVIKPSNPG